MFPRKKQKRKLRKALKDTNLQQALSRASDHHYQKYKNNKKEIPWEEYKEKARTIKEECTRIIPQLIQEFTSEAKKAGAQVYEASTPDEALLQIEKIVRKRNLLPLSMPLPERPQNWR